MLCGKPLSCRWAGPMWLATSHSVSPLSGGVVDLSRTTSILSRSRIVALAMATAAASLVAVAGAAPPAAAASAACPWVGSSAPIAQRVSQLLSHMSTTQKVSLLTGASGSSYVGFTPAIGSLCIPAMNLEDGPAGAGDGMSTRTHVAGYNQEPSRNTPSDNAVVSNRTMQEIYLPAFQDSVQQGAASSVMCS